MVPKPVPTTLRHPSSQSLLKSGPFRLKVKASNDSTGPNRSQSLLKSGPFRCCEARGDFPLARGRNPFLNQVHSDPEILGQHLAAECSGRNPFLNQVHSDEDSITKHKNILVAPESQSLLKSGPFRWCKIEKNISDRVLKVAIPS